MKWHTVERLSPRQALTPDGFLIVTDTIIARCGDQIYHHNEVPLDPDDDGVITVSRDAADVFRPEAIASFEGKPITDDHPDEEVTPINHRELAIGHVQNVRRGTGMDSDCLVADLVFTDADAIAKVRGRRKLALSCGYDAHYESLGRGRGAQRKIVGNHVALVDEGRCGARCTIGDSGAAIYSYLAAKARDHKVGCGCEVCDQPAKPAKPATKPAKPATRPAKPARRLVLWVDGVRVWSRRLKTRDAFDPNEPRKGKGEGGGEWTSSGGGGSGAGGGEAAGGAKADIPKKPGSTPIPEGNVRLYHQTHNAEVLEKIRTEGIKLSAAKGIEGPRSVYADPKGFYGSPEDIPTVEFSVPKSRSDGPFVTGGDVDPKDIIAIHYPWHAVARQIEGNPQTMQAVLAGQRDRLLNDPKYGPAIKYIKDKWGGKSNPKPLSSTSKEPSHGNAEPTSHDPAGVPGGPSQNVSARFTRRTAGGTGGGGLRSDGSGVRASFQSRDKDSPAPNWDELAQGSGEAFANHITESKKASPYGAAVAVYPTEEYNQMRLFTTPDAKAGFALHDDDIISVFRKSDGPRNVVGPILDLAVQEGGRKLDCFDTVLPKLYAQHGFRAVARLAFNDEYKPDGWDYATYGKFNAGRPDVVFMTYDPKYGKPYQPGDGEVVSTYEDGQALQKAALAGKTKDAFDPNEKRDDDGKWTTGGGGGGASAGSSGGKPSETFKKGEAITSTPLNGKAFETWHDAPKDNKGWEKLAFDDDDTHPFTEPPPPKVPPGKHLGAGVIIREPDGRVWIVHPANEYGGYKATFPKGTVEDGMSLRGTALKEAFEESGLGVRLTGFAGDIERDTSVARYYYAERMAGTPADAGWESQAVTLSPVSELKNHLNKKVDHDIVDTFFGGKVKAAVTGSAKTPKTYDPSGLGEPDFKIGPTLAGGTPVGQAVAAAKQAPDAPTDISKWKKVSGNKGSNPGGQYLDEKGDTHYVKLQKSNDHAKNEFLAARLFEAAGSPVLNTRLVDLGGGKLGTETAWKDKTNIDLNDKAHREMAQENFATNAWLANWDAIGMGQHENDWNQAIVDGKMTTVDPGGSMIFRAQGDPKGAAWGDSVGEWDTMRHGKNPQANKAYGDMTNKQLRDSVLKVIKTPDKTIRELVGKHGPGDVAARLELANRLIARKRDLMKRAMTTDAIWRRAA